jgi:hypothetical protein
MTLGGLGQDLRKLADILLLLAKDLEDLKDLELLPGQIFQVARQGFVPCLPESEACFVF